MAAYSNVIGLVYPTLGKTIAGSIHVHWNYDEEEDAVVYRTPYLEAANNLCSYYKKKKIFRVSKKKCGDKYYISISLI